jgi:hypothetical protein
MTPSDCDAACAEAIQLQLAGNLDAATERYLQILAALPQHAAANYCLGMLCVQQKRTLDSLSYLKVAVESQPAMVDYWLGYLEALMLAGQNELAKKFLVIGRQQGLKGPAVDELARRLEHQERKTPTTALRRFLVVTPPFDHQSAGIRVMHDLCDELNRLGHESHLVFYRFRPGGAECYTSVADADFGPQHRHIPRLPATTDMESFRTLIDEAAVIYPEVILGNPLRSPRVVRYVLNDPAVNGYPMLHGERDFIVGFLPQYFKNPHFIATLLYEEPIFNDRDTRPALERGMDCTYVGKGMNFGPCFKVPGSVSIERKWPADKDSLAAMLRNTRYFFTWDLISQTNADAMLCGAIPVTMRMEPFSPSIFETAFGPVTFGTARQVEGRWTVDVDMDLFESRRRGFVHSYQSLAADRQGIVDRLAQAILRYFGSQVR